jgi:hypothetical protein
MRVLHSRFGSGTVLAIEDEGILRVRFDASGASCRMCPDYVIRWGDTEVLVTERPPGLPGRLLAQRGGGHEA